MRSFVIVSCAVLIAIVLTWSVQRVVGKPSPVEAVAVQDDGQRRPIGRGPGAGAALATMLGRDELTQTVSLLADLNLTPTFTLSQDQKTKIHAVRERVKQAQEVWRKENQAQLDKLSEEARAARDTAAEPGSDQELRQKRQDLMASAPKVDEAAKEILAVLTPEQRKVYDAALAKRRDEQQQARERGRQPLRGGGGSSSGARRPLPRN